MKDKPVPWHVELSVAIFANVKAAAALLSLPFGVVGYALAANGITINTLAPGPEKVVAIPPLAQGASWWVAGALAVLLLLSRPY